MGRRQLEEAVLLLGRLGGMGRRKAAEWSARTWGEIRSEKGLLLWVLVGCTKSSFTTRDSVARLSAWGKMDLRLGGELPPPPRALRAVDLDVCCILHRSVPPQLLEDGCERTSRKRAQA